MEKQDTPNSRLARVLRILADVAERGPLSGAARDALLSVYDYEFTDFDEALGCAEVEATDAARLAGVPVPLPAPYRPEETTDEQR